MIIPKISKIITCENLIIVKMWQKMQLFFYYIDKLMTIEFILKNKFREKRKNCHCRLGTTEWKFSLVPKTQYKKQGKVIFRERHLVFNFNVNTCFRNRWKITTSKINNAWFNENRLQKRRNWKGWATANRNTKRTLWIE